MNLPLHIIIRPQEHQTDQVLRRLLYVALNTEKWNAWLTQKLQAREPYVLDMSCIDIHMLDTVSKVQLYGRPC